MRQHAIVCVDVERDQSAHRGDAVERVLEECPLAVLPCFQWMDVSATRTLSPRPPNARFHIGGTDAYDTHKCRSYLDRHSARFRASSRQSGGNRLERG
jgi:hypothetical protein